MITPGSSTAPPNPPPGDPDREMWLVIRQACLMGIKGLELVARQIEKRYGMIRK